MVSPFNLAAAVFVVAVTIKTESLNGFPIALQKCLQKQILLNSLLAFPVLPLPIILVWLYLTLKCPKSF